MTPTAWIKVTIRAVIAAILIGIGFKLGNMSSEKARAALQAEIVKQNLAKTELEHSQAQLIANNQQLTAQYELREKAIEAGYKASEDKWVQLVASQNSTIASLKSQINSTKASINVLQAERDSAKTPEDKARIEAEIQRQSSSLISLQTRDDGLECLGKVIPDDYLSLVNAK